MSEVSSLVMILADSTGTIEDLRLAAKMVHALARQRAVYSAVS